LFAIIVGSWLLTLANWKGWWSISSTTLLSGVSSAVSPVCVFLSMWDSSPASDTSHGPN